MNTPPNVYFLGGGGPQQQPTGHRPKRRRKNRDARKRDKEKKDEKDTKEKNKNLRTAMWRITFWTPVIFIPLSLSWAGILKLMVFIQELNIHLIKGMFK